MNKPLRLSRFTHGGIKGFRNVDCSAHRDWQAGEILVIAWFDGEPELWQTDCGQLGIETIRNFYKDEWGSRYIPFDTFTIHSSDR